MTNKISLYNPEANPLGPEKLNETRVNQGSVVYHGCAFRDQNKSRHAGRKIFGHPIPHLEEDPFDTMGERMQLKLRQEDRDAVQCDLMGQIHTQSRLSQIETRRSVSETDSTFC